MNLNKAVEEWKRKIGEKNVLLEDMTSKYNGRCIQTENSVKCVLRPKSKDEIQEILKIANNYKIAVYPISTGKNWGYGTSLPVQNNDVVIDLSKMNKILEVNEKFAYAIIEPGVSQEQLSTYLQDKGYNLQIDPTGSSPSSSVLGNSIERGFGIGVRNDHFDSISGMEVVMPTGEVLRTGFWHYENAKTKCLYKYGVGAYIDGLFSQSNFGIVTKICMWLEKKPEYMEAFFAKCDKEENFPKLIDKIRELRLGGTIRSPVNFLHKYRALTLKESIPKEYMHKAIPKQVLDDLSNKEGVSTWNIVGAIYGTKDEVKAYKKKIKKEIKNLAKPLVFVNQKEVNFVNKHKKFLKRPVNMLMRLDIEQLAYSIVGSFKILNGIPSEVSMRTPYWRSQNLFPEKNSDPGKDNCGLYWVAPILPLDGKSVEEAFELGNKIFKKYNLDMVATFTIASGRTVDSTIPVLYDKDDADECKRADDCYRELIREFMKHGFIPYRIGISSMNEIIDEKDIFWQTLSKIKTALDPNNIMSPKRYNLK